jgi:hypothetical protein
MEYFLLFLGGAWFGSIVAFGIFCLCAINKNDKGE